MEGFVKLHRKLLENPVITKDADYLSLWVYMLLLATHKERPALFGKEKIILQPGQFISGRKDLSIKTGVEQNKINRILKAFKSDQMIEQQSCSKGSLFTVLNWDIYQFNEQQNKQQMNNERTASEQQSNNERTTDEQPANNERTASEQPVNTKQERKNVRSEEDKDIVFSDQKNSSVSKPVPPYEDIINLLNSITGKNFRPNVKETRKHINARFGEGYTIDDFRKVIEVKTRQWKGTEDERYLRPQTLFGTKFEGYLNSYSSEKGSNQDAQNRPVREQVKSLTQLAAEQRAGAGT